MKQILLKTWLMLVCLLCGVGTTWATDVAYKTAKFGTQATSGTSTGYTSTYESVTNGFSVSVANGNTNGTTWDCVKFGRKGNTSVGTITTSNAIDKAITKVVLTIDAITATNVNSIKLYTGASANECTTEVGTFSSTTGDQTVNISNPAANKFYKVSIDCKSGSGNGFVAVSKVVYYYDDAAGGGSGDGDGDSDGTITINMDKLTNPNTTQTITYGTYNWTSGTVSGVYNGASSSANTSLQFNYSSSGSSNYRDKQALYNTVAIPGKITSIKMITASGSNRSWTPYVSSSAITPANYTSATALTAKTVNSGEGTTWEVTGNNTYFYLNYTTGSASYIGDIVITYTTNDGEDPEPEKTTPSLSFAQVTYNATMGEPFVAPTLTNEQNVTVAYSSSDADVATVDETSGEISLVAAGTTTITASFAGNETYKAAEASYQLVVAAAPAPKYAISYAATDNGTIVVKNGETVLAEGAEVAAGTKLTIVCTPTDAENYRFKNWQYKVGEGSWTTKYSNNQEFDMPDGNTQFRANFELIPVYTVAFSVNGNTIKSDDLKEGTAVTVPDTPEDINGKVFTGWIKTATVEGETPVYVTPATTATEDVTYYAVFANEEVGGDVTYTKVSTISNGTYLMATVTADQFVSKTTLAYAGQKLNEATPPVYVWGEVTPVSITDNVISTKPETAKEITITVGTGDDANYFSMYDGESYITMTEKGKFTYASNPSYEWELNLNGIHNKGTYDKVSTWYIYVNNGNSGAQSEYFVPVKQKNEGNNGGNYYYYAQLFKKEGGATYSNYTTTPTPLILLDENSESTDEVVEEGVKVNVKRAIRAGYWSPLCLPFDMTEEQIADNFGADAEVKSFSGLEIDGENYNLKFTEATAIEAGTCYMVRLQNPITEINVNDVDVCMSEDFYNATTQEEFDADENVVSITFKGNYYNNTTVPVGSYIINSNKFYFVNSTVVNKGFRGYFTVANSANSNKAVKLNFSFDDVLTGIEGITVEGLDNNIFDLQGRRVQRLQKGVNIVNGKKVLR